MSPEAKENFEGLGIVAAMLLAGFTVVSATSAAFAYLDNNGLKSPKSEIAKPLPKREITKPSDLQIGSRRKFLLNAKPLQQPRP